MEVICAVDLGTSKIRAILAYNEDGIPKIKGVFNSASSGLRKGSIIDLSASTKALRNVLDEIRQLDRKALKNIYINIGTPETNTHFSGAGIPISSQENEISYQDVEKVKKLSEAISLGSNRTIIHNIPQEYIIDGVSNIEDPIGLSGTRLEVKSLIIESFSPYIKNIEKTVFLSGGKFRGMIFNPISSSRVVLSKIQKELGVILIDLGFQTTSFAVYEENKLLSAKILPLGSSNITADIAAGLKIPYEIAEELKVKEGCAWPKKINARESIDLKNFILNGNNGEKVVVSKRFLSEIIEARLCEIFELINKELKSLSKNLKLAGGVTIVGGGAKLKGLTELAKNELKLSSQIGLPLLNEFKFDIENPEILNDPEYANVLGLVLWGSFYERWRPKSKSFLDKVKNFFKIFEP